jgi:SAM-dependent methyltransferase
MPNAYTNGSEQEPFLAHTKSVGEGQHSGKMQGHWMLACAGKRVLRPGGIELTQQMLRALAIGPQDRVVEFAPGFGVTAGTVLRRRPLEYWGVERDPESAEYLRRKLAATNARIILGPAEASGLPTACATVVYGEALLSMQGQRQKHQIVAEACRLLVPGGRYGMHELCLWPDDIPDHLRHEIEAELSKEIHVGVQPLTRSEWRKVFEENGLKVIWSGKAAMHLLEPGRVLRDEGFGGSLRVAFHMVADPVLRQRILAMRRLFRRYAVHLGAIAMVGQREQGEH